MAFNQAAEMTDEERAMFAAHGVTDLGGQSDVIEGEVLNAGGDENTQTPPASDEAAGQPGQEVTQDPQTVEGDANGQQAQPGAPQQQDNRTVPIAALHEARRIQAEAQQRAQLATVRMNALLQAQRDREAQQQRPMPDLREDPEAYIQTLEQRLSEFDAARNEEIQTRELDTAIAEDERLFAAATPDYEQATNYYVQSRGRELLLTYSPDQAQKIMGDEVRQIARTAWSRGQSTGQMLYSLAQARGYAYAPQQPAARPQGGPAPLPQGGQPAPTQQRTAAPTPQAIVEAQRRGAPNSRSLSAAGGASPEELNAQALLAMSDEEFEAAIGVGTKGADTNFQKVFQSR